MPRWVVTGGKLVASYAAAGIVGAIAVAAAAWAIQPGLFRDIAVLVLLLAAIAGGTRLALAWVIPDSHPMPAAVTAGTTDPIEALGAARIRGIYLYNTLSSLSGDPAETASAVRSALDKWEAQSRDALTAAGVGLDEFDAPITGLEGMHFNDRPLEILRIKIDRLDILSK